MKKEMFQIKVVGFNESIIIMWTTSHLEGGIREVWFEIHVKSPLYLTETKNRNFIEIGSATSGILA
jgi:hypothetical protein